MTYMPPLLHGTMVQTGGGGGGGGGAYYISSKYDTCVYVSHAKRVHAVLILV